MQTFFLRFYFCVCVYVCLCFDFTFSFTFVVTFVNANTVGYHCACQSVPQAMKPALTWTNGHDFQCNTGYTGDSTNARTDVDECAGDKTTVTLRPKHG